MISAISLKNVRKNFGSFTAISDVSFDIKDNEFFTLLGPSGCGKTTLLRLIAGFEDTTEGAIHLYGDEIENLPPNKRPVNTVFQNYALFPHMTVTENIGFSLKMLGWKVAEIEARVAEMVSMVQLNEFVHRKPSQMSGGQQQRVALARAMASRPKVLLLDEPLSALDLKLRQEMRSELKRLQRETGITFIFVTHDQEEALSMSDRIAVMSAGRVQQIGSPSEIYEFPSNKFVADFIGETNLLEVMIASVDGQKLICTLPSGKALHALAAQPIEAGRRGMISLRPERLTLAQSNGTESGLRGTLVDATYLGTDIQYGVQLDEGPVLTVRSQNNTGGLERFARGDPVTIKVADNAARFLVD